MGQIVFKQGHVILKLTPIQQFIFLKEGMEIDEALNVQAHIVVAMDKAQPNKGTGS